MTRSQKGDYKQSNLWCLVQTMFNTYCALLNCYLALSFVALPIELLMLFAAVTDRSTPGTSTTFRLNCFRLTSFKSACRHIVIRFTWLVSTD